VRSHGFQAFLVCSNPGWNSLTILKSLVETKDVYGRGAMIPAFPSACFASANDQEGRERKAFKILISLTRQSGIS
jgi:hypothetical protein